MVKITGCRILVKPFTIEEEDEAYMRAKALGIRIPEKTEREKMSLIDKGTVLQIGPSCDKTYVEGLQVGDTIGFTKFGGKFVKSLDGKEEFLVINDEDVIVIYKDE